MFYTVKTYSDVHEKPHVFNIWFEDDLIQTARVRAAAIRSPLTPTSWETSLQASPRMFRSRYVGELRSYRHGNPETAVISLYSMLKLRETMDPEINGELRKYFRFRCRAATLLAAARLRHRQGRTVTALQAS